MPAAPATYMLALVSPVIGPGGQLKITPVGQFGDLEAVLLHIKEQKLTVYVVYQNLPVLAVGLAAPAIDLEALKSHTFNGG